jgi:hypothetical protein
MTRWLTTALFAGAFLIAVSQAAADVRVTSHPYVRAGGGSDLTIASCSSTASDPEPDAAVPEPGDEGAALRQQNEPAAAVDPSNPRHMTAGSNDYCTSATIGDVWAGFYYSADGGGTWTDSLLPGYPTDTSTPGQASPLFGLVSGAGDPSQAWDLDGHLYYAGIAFNRVRPANGSIWLARYSWPGASAAPTYEFTSLVSRGTPTAFGIGHFEDKVMVEVDRGVDSPYEGNVYICWTRYTSSASNNFVEFVRSTDGGHTFTRQKLSSGIHGNQFCDVTVTRDGTVFVGWEQYAFRNGRQTDAVAWAKSTDGGRSFTKPGIAATFTPWIPQDSGSGECGDGPLACPSGYVFHRGGTAVRITSDPTADGDPDAAYVVYDAIVPGTEAPTGTTYGTVSPGIGGQIGVFLVGTTNGGTTWSEPALIDPQPTGHQYFPDIDADGGSLHAMWQDSRFDCAAGPPGRDFTAVPVANLWVAANPPGSVSCEDPPGSDTAGLTTMYAVSSDGGANWESEPVADALTMPQYEQFGARDDAFFGDYNFISAESGTVLIDWTDQRDTIPGDDPRYTNGDGTDGFDVDMCVVETAPGVFSGNRCPNSGGLDQNIYGAIVVP